MRRTASEVLTDLERRVSRMEREAGLLKSVRGIFGEDPLEVRRTHERKIKSFLMGINIDEGEITDVDLSLESDLRDARFLKNALLLTIDTRYYGVQKFKFYVSVLKDEGELYKTASLYGYKTTYKFHALSPDDARFVVSFKGDKLMAQEGRVSNEIRLAIVNRGFYLR